MTDLLIAPTGEMMARAWGDEARDVLTTMGATDPILRLNMNVGPTALTVWMSVDLALPVNMTARKALADLTALHVVCHGPVLLVGLSDDMIEEVIGGAD